MGLTVLQNFKIFGLQVGDDFTVFRHDGIHLDQVRYYEGDPLRWGYNPTSVARFNQQFDREPESQPAARDPDWVAWRRDQVTELVRRIHTLAKAIKPSVAVTAAVVTWGKGPQTAADWQTQAPYSSVLQDWRGWLLSA